MNSPLPTKTKIGFGRIPQLPSCVDVKSPGTRKAMRTGLKRHLKESRRQLAELER